MKTMLKPLQNTALAFVFILFAGWVLSSCNGGNGPDGPSNTKLVNAIRISTITKETMQSVVQGNELFAPVLQYIQHDMTLYRIIYTTNYKGIDILVSGLVSVPVGVENPKIISAHHGTIFANNQAPSNVVVNLATGGSLGFELFGSAGYITFVADYIGYGESNSVQHPYYDRDLTASTIIDMITAGKEFLVDEGISFQDDLFLIGYSEGGFATMATLDALESSNNPLSSNIKAVAAGAGGFYIQGIMDDVLNRTEHPEPGFLGFVVRSYNETYEWGRPYTDFFQEPYASRIAGGLLDGNNDKAAVNSQLTSIIDDYINPSFKTGLLQSTENQMLDAMALNSVHNFVPQHEVRVYHSPNDEVLTIENSRFTVQNINNLGASNVSFHEIGGDSHAAAVFSMIDEALSWFNTFQ